MARTPSAAAALPTARRSGSLLCLLAAALSAGVALAEPAAAVDDPSRPDSRVTHGPSCRPGGVVVEVTGGTVPYAVTLATTRSPLGEDSAEVRPGAIVVLSSGDVDWAETIDGRLEFTALDGSGTTFVDELEGYTFTRPAAEDCAAITVPAAAATVPLEPGTGERGDGGAPDADGAATPADDAGPVGALPDGTRPDGTRPGGTDAPGAAEAAAAGRVIAPGTATPVDPAEVGAAPAALAASTPFGPLVAAALALGAAAAGLAGVLGRSRRVLRPPTASG